MNKIILFLQIIFIGLIAAQIASVPKTYEFQPYELIVKRFGNLTETIGLINLYSQYFSCNATLDYNTDYVTGTLISDYQYFKLQKNWILSRY